MASACDENVGREIQETQSLEHKGFVVQSTVLNAIQKEKWSTQSDKITHTANSNLGCSSSVCVCGELEVPLQKEEWGRQTGSARLCTSCQPFQVTCAVVPLNQSPI